MRRAAHNRLRNTVYHWARIAIQHDQKSRSRYMALRQRGHSHGRPIRGVADRLLKLACTLLQRQTVFDPNYSAPGHSMKDRPLCSTKADIPSVPTAAQHRAQSAVQDATPCGTARRREAS
jgi:hypothetical protein